MREVDGPSPSSMSAPTKHSNGRSRRSCEAGGPWAIFITTYDLDGPHSAPYDVEVAGERSSYRIGANAELQVEPIRNPVTGNDVHPRLLLPEGLLTPDLGLYRSQKFRVDGGISYDHSGRYAAVGAFANTGP